MFLLDIAWNRMNAAKFWSFYSIFKVYKICDINTVTYYEYDEHKWSSYASINWPVFFLSKSDLNVIQFNVYSKYICNEWIVIMAFEYNFNPLIQ